MPRADVFRQPDHTTYTAHLFSFTADRDMDVADAFLNLSLAPLDIITKILQCLCDKDRFTSALVSKAWAKAAAAATRVIMVSQPTLQKFNCLQQWMMKHGNQLLSLQLHECGGAALTTLPCAQLQDLLLHGGYQHGSKFDIDSRVWSDIAAATKLTSIALQRLQTASHQADVVAALTAMQHLKQLTWRDVQCSGEQQLSDSLLLQHLTKLTVLKLEIVSAAALEHLGLLTNLECLRVSGAEGCPALQELKALTRLQLWLRAEEDTPASVCQLAALQQLNVWRATPTALNGLQTLTGLTQLWVQHLEELPLNSPPLQLPGLQCLMLWGLPSLLPVSFLTNCTQLRKLKLWAIDFSGPGSLAASIMLQDLELHSCRISAAAGAAGGPVSWQQVLPDSGQLPHLTSLQLSAMQPKLQQVDMEHVVACYSSLQVLQLASLHDSVEAGSFASALAQLTGLRELTMNCPGWASVAGLQQLAALEQLTSLGFVWWPGKASPVLQAQMSDRLPGCKHAIVNQAPAGHPSDVPARLLRMCDVAAALTAEAAS